VLKEDIMCFVRGLVDYTELRVQRNTETQIKLLNGNVIENQRKENTGVSSRVRYKGMWGFASSPILTNNEIIDVIDKATTNAKILGEKRNISFQELSVHNEESSLNLSSDDSFYSSQQLMIFLCEIDTFILKECSEIKSRTVYYSGRDIEKNLVTSQGASSYSLIPSSYITVTMKLDHHEEVISFSDNIGGTRDFNEVFSNKEIVFDKVREIYKHLLAKRDAIQVKAGQYDVILTGGLSGMLAHEAIGHPTEADVVLGGSVATDNIEKQVASDLITLIDFANQYNGEYCPFPVFIDDGGVTACDVTIIKNGVLKGYMHNRETALKFKVKPTGNARAYTYGDIPLIRMRNTAILPGDSTLDEMIKSIDKGYYLMNTNKGQADTTGEFMFGVTLGYEIIDGKLGKAINDTTISGFAFDVLKSVSMVANDMTWDASGLCGKMQPMPTASGGPTIKCRINIGGN